MLVLSYFALGVGLFFAAIPLVFVVKILRSDRMEGKKSAARVAGVTDAVLGRSRTRDDWIPDGRVKGGMVYNRRKKRLEVCGRLSDDSLDRVFR